ncbi:hypothetical protein MTR_2g086277 [Medicago truncatula]|uniref:Uncharacterized protein n=1 Tax=Medicago truncatula TaxID=3880 RepID=A0A072VC30_MEDTR|nr:hypothetical protein MTR_2g086277 [Medicago truncatula]
MPFELDVLIWKNILSACLKDNNFVMGNTAAFQALELAPEDSIRKESDGNPLFTSNQVIRLKWLGLMSSTKDELVRELELSPG